MNLTHQRSKHGLRLGGMVFLMFSALASCTDGSLPVGWEDGEAIPTALLLSPVHAGPAMANGLPTLAVNRIRLTARHADTGEVLGQSVQDVDPDADGWEVQVEVGLTDDSTVPVVVLVEMLNVGPDGERPAYSGRTGIIQARPGEDASVAQVAVYPGSPANLSITSVRILEVPPAMVEGGQAQLQIQVEGADGEADVFWLSLDPQVAQVTPDGLVQALLPGAARIVALAGPRTDTVSIPVDPRPDVVVVTPESATLVALDETADFQAQVLDPRGDPIPDMPVTWSSGDGSVSLHLGGGVFRAVGPGSTSVTAEVSGVAGQGTLEVAPVVQRLTMDPESVLLSALGASVQLDATPRDANGFPVAGEAVSWSSSAVQVADVDAAGLVTARGPGSAVIQARSGDLEATATVRVEQVVTSLVVTPEAVLLTSLGARDRFQASPRDANGNPVIGAGVEWTSSNPAVATVTQEGDATAVAPGTALIMATAEGVTGSATVTVDAIPASVSVTPGAVTLPSVGSTIPLAAQVLDANGNAVPAAVVTWTSSAPGVASVDPSGMVTAHAAGSAVITAASQGASGSATITVDPIPAGVTVTPGSLGLNHVGATGTLQAVVVDAGGTGIPGAPLVWSSSLPGVVSVDGSGLVTAHAVGTATVTATSGSVAGTATVAVTQLANGVTITPSTLSLLYLGTTGTLSAQVLDAGGNPVPDAGVGWTSSDPGVASVNATGLVTAVSQGTATISATAGSASGTATVDVTAGPSAALSTATVPTAAEAGLPVALAIQLRNALGDPFALGGDEVRITVTGSNPVAEFLATPVGGGAYTATYTPLLQGIDVIDVVLVRADGALLGPISGSPYQVTLTNPTQVTNTADSGQGSLRRALENANALPGRDSITFAIPGTGPHTISLQSPLPGITEEVVVDGATQAGFDGLPVVEVDGTGVTGTGFEIHAGNVTLRGLSVTNFPNDGVVILPGAMGTTIETSAIGTDRVGTPGKGNQQAGIRQQGSGGTLLNNLISGNGQSGVVLDGSAATGNLVQGNVIGLDPSGAGPLANGWNGVTLSDGASNNIFQGNTISGNTLYGIDIQHSGTLLPVTGTQILGNSVGLTLAGEVVRHSGTDFIDGSSVNWGAFDRGNQEGGIRLQSATGTVIGTPGQGNTISGNRGDGVRVEGDATGVTLRANRIGTNPQGDAQRGNGTDGRDGIVVTGGGASNLTIGGTGAGEGNVISGNFSDGVRILGATSNVTVQGNFIGTNAAGTAALGNGLADMPQCCASGLQVDDGTGIVIGGAAVGAGNLISGNATGLWIGSAPSVQIQGNQVGTNLSGLGLIPNGGDAGVALYGTMGGQVVDNTISGSTGLAGVFLSTGSQNNLLLGNTLQQNSSAAIVLDPTAGSGNTFRTNSMSNNGSGIDLNWDGVSGNDALDADSGPNRMQNWPPLVSAHNTDLTNTVLQTGLILGEPNTTYELEVFSSSVCHGSGHGEGAESVQLLTLPAPTDGSGELSLSTSFPQQPTGRVITATLTHPDGSTSEFSNCVTVVVPPIIDEVHPFPAAGSNQGLTFLGSNLLNTQWTFTNTATEAVTNGFTFQPPSTAQRQHVQPGTLAAGTYEVRVQDMISGGVSDPVTLTIQSQFGTPTLVGVFGDATSLVDLMSILPGATIYIQGYGIYTSGTAACFTQGTTAPVGGPTCAGTLVTSTASSSSATGGLRARVVVPAVTSGDVWIQIRSGDSNFTEPVSLTVPPF